MELLFLSVHMGGLRRKYKFKLSSYIPNSEVFSKNLKNIFQLELNLKQQNLTQ